MIHCRSKFLKKHAMPNVHDLTHTVSNQPPDFLGTNLYAGDQVLRHWMDALGGSWGHERGNQGLLHTFSGS